MDSDPRLLSQRRDSYLLFFFKSSHVYGGYISQTASSGSATNFFDKIRRERRWKGAVWQILISWFRRLSVVKISNLRWWRMNINRTCLVTSLETGRCCVSDYLLLFFNIDGLRHLSCVLRSFFLAVMKRHNGMIDHTLKSPIVSTNQTLLILYY